MTRNGFVGILVFELHIPDAGSLKAKRSVVKSIKGQLQQRCHAAVAEVDHHELWQRAKLTAAFAARDGRGAHEQLEAAERLVLSHVIDAGPFTRIVIAPEDIIE